MSGNLKSAFLYNDRTNQYYLLASSGTEDFTYEPSTHLFDNSCFLLRLRPHDITGDPAHMVVKFHWCERAHHGTAIHYGVRLYPNARVNILTCLCV